MINKHFNKMYKRLKFLIINSELSNVFESIITDDKYIIRNRTTFETVNITLTKEEIANLKNHIYNEKTAILKELSYMINIRNSEICKFETEEERNLFIKANKNYNKKPLARYSKNIFSDITYSILNFLVNFNSDSREAYIGAQILTIFITVFILLIIGEFETVSIKLLCKAGIIVALSPTEFLIAKKLLEKRLERYKTRKFIASKVENAYINTESEHIKLESKNEIYKIQNQKDEEHLNEPIYNEIYKLLKLLSENDLENNIKYSLLNKIKQIKLEYEEKCSNLNSNTLSIETEISIQNYIIKKLAIIEYEIKSLVESLNKEKIINNESKLIDKMIIH